MTWGEIILVFILLLMFAPRGQGKRQRGSGVRTAKTSPHSHPPVTPGPGIEPCCPMCGTWLRDLGDNYGCGKYGWKTKDIRKTGPTLPYGVKE